MCEPVSCGIFAVVVLLLLALGMMGSFMGVIGQVGNGLGPLIPVGAVAILGGTIYVIVKRMMEDPQIVATYHTVTGMPLTGVPVAAHPSPSGFPLLPGQVIQATVVEPAKAMEAVKASPAQALRGMETNATNAVPKETALNA